MSVHIACFYSIRLAGSAPRASSCQSCPRRSPIGSSTLQTREVGGCSRCRNVQHVRAGAGGDGWDKHVPCAKRRSWLWETGVQHRHARQNAQRYPCRLCRIRKIVCIILSQWHREKNGRPGCSLFLVRCVRLLHWQAYQAIPLKSGMIHHLLLRSRGNTKMTLLFIPTTYLFVHQAPILRLVDDGQRTRVERPSRAPAAD